jgi:hypothetical protein
MRVAREVGGWLVRNFIFVGSVPFANVADANSREGATTRAQSSFSISIRALSSRRRWAKTRDRGCLSRCRRQWPLTKLVVEG